MLSDEDWAALDPTTAPSIAESFRRIKAREDDLRKGQGRFVTCHYNLFGPLQPDNDGDEFYFVPENGVWNTIGQMATASTAGIRWDHPHPPVSRARWLLVWNADSAVIEARLGTIGQGHEDGDPHPWPEFVTLAEITPNTTPNGDIGAARPREAYITTGVQQAVNGGFYRALIMQFRGNGSAGFRMTLSRVEITYGPF